MSPFERLSPAKGVLGHLLRAKRKKGDLNQREAAAEIGVSYSTLSRLEAGLVTANIPLGSFLAVCVWLGLSNKQVVAIAWELTFDTEPGE